MPAFSKLALTFSAIFAIIVAVLTLAASNDDAIISKEIADALNQIPGKTWTASENQGTLSGATIGDIKKRLGYKKMKADSTLPRKTFSAKEKVDLPASFNAADKWPECPTIKMISDQSSCGSCWSMSSTNAASDRFCTFGVEKDLYLSPANTMECCWYCGDGCNGGSPAEAQQYFKNNGVPSQTCQPYPFPSCAHHVNESGVPPCPAQDAPTPSCPGNVCTNNETNPVYKNYYASDAYTLMGEEDYMQELYQNGPFAVAFTVYSDFPSYKGGVYTHTSGSELGGHAVRIVGWGTLNGTPYWLISNSWNAGWGVNGQFMIKRGVDECGIELSGSAMKPASN